MHHVIQWLFFTCPCLLRTTKLCCCYSLIISHQGQHLHQVGLHSGVKQESCTSPDMHCNPNVRLALFVVNAFFWRALLSLSLGKCDQLAATSFLDGIVQQLRIYVPGTGYCTHNPPCMAAGGLYCGIVRKLAFSRVRGYLTPGRACYPGPAAESDNKYLWRSVI